jgi:hypothetical protein
MEILTHEEYAEIIVNSPTYGEFRAKIDLEDVDRCKNHKWNVNKYKRLNYERFYIVSGSNGLMLHRFLMNAEKGKVVDHIDNDSMNNRKSNLRVCLHKENSRNSKDRVNNSSGHKGVSWYKKNNKWMAYIMVDKKHKTLGYFHDINDAINARRLAEEKYFGEYRNQNTE